MNDKELVLSICSLPLKLVWMSRKDYHRLAYLISYKLNYYEAKIPVQESDSGKQDFILREAASGTNDNEVCFVKRGVSNLEKNLNYKQGWGYSKLRYSPQPKEIGIFCLFSWLQMSELLCPNLHGCYLQASVSCLSISFEICANLCKFINFYIPRT